MDAHTRRLNVDDDAETDVDDERMFKFYLLSPRVGFARRECVERRNVSGYHTRLSPKNG